MPATVLAAANRGARIDQTATDAQVLPLIPTDIHGAIRQGTESDLVVFVVDASGSMAARDRLAAVTGAVTSLLRDAYQNRDKVAVVAFRGGGAEVLLPPTKSIDAAVRRLADVRTGGRTPLAQGLITAHDLVAREARKEPSRRAIMVLLSDGRATGQDGLRQARAAAATIRRQALAASVVIDCERSRVRLGLAQEIAAEMGATCVNLTELSAESVAGVVRAYHHSHGTRKA
ncbi:MAG: VWA domain-containing protein [Corynebacterium sp.]|nr:VWA domain-containing protein [Corynebacterium sp.]MDO5029271.1 VWA domain-containing protein [Corynebacterium sp.]